VECLKLTWKYYNAKFDFDNQHADFLHQSAWVGHRAFAYDFVRFIQPNRNVELGTHYGISFFTFCQAMQDGGLEGDCVAVDTWEGDAHSGSYSEEVYQVVSGFAKQYRCARLIRDTFDGAVSQFEDESIDLLHIDGLHTWEAVKHDFESWLPKLSPHGVVLFHDIDVKIADFGVYLFWDELKREIPYHLEFHHSAGLGVLFPKELNEASKVVVENRDSIIGGYR
jgi:hypothetical protein